MAVAQDEPANETADQIDFLARDEQDRPVIIVTGTKRAESLQKVEASVAVTTAEKIEQQSLFNVNDILLRTANVSTAGSRSLNSLSIRGVALTGNGGTGTTANVYVDGAPNSRNSNEGAQNLWDVGQVEILRGPQSTVQGRNALSGAVVINTTDPEYNWSGKGRVIVGTQNTRQYAGVLNGEVVPGQLAFRIAAEYTEDDFEVFNLIQNIPSRFNEALNLRGKILFEPEFLEGLRIETTVSYVDTEFGDFGSVNAPAPLGTPEFEAFDPFGDETFNRTSGINQNTVWRGVLDVNYEISDTWEVFALGTIEDVDAFTDLQDFGFFQDSDRTYSGELRASFDYGDVSGWIGGYYFDGEIPSVIGVGIPLTLLDTGVTPSNSTATIVTNSNQVTENYAIFGDIAWDISEKWTVNVAARYDWESFFNSGLRGELVIEPDTCVLPSFGGLPCAVALSAIAGTDEPPAGSDFQAFLPRVSVTHNFSDTKALSFTIARGYRAGGALPFVPPTPDGTIGQIEIREFDPEFLTNYELAWRSQFLDETITINANVFYSDWSDQQVSIPASDGRLFGAEPTNAGQSRLYGMELDFGAEATSTLNVFTSLGISFTEYIDFPFAVDEDGNPTNPDDPQFANLAGNEFPAAPNITWSGGFTWNHPDGFFFNGSFSYTSEQQSEVANLQINKGDDFWLVNARLGYRISDWGEIALFGNNILDQRFITDQGLQFVNAQTGTVANNSPTPFFTVSDPFVGGLQVSVNF